MVTTNVGAGSSGARKSKKKPRQRLNVPGRDTEGRASMQEEITPHKAKYLEYLQSPEWQEKRKAALGRAGHRCQLCASRSRLQVHHNSYANLYREAPQDLTVLCDGCHEKHHDIGERKDSPRRKAQASRPKPLKAFPSLPVACPQCGALPWKPCVRSHGNARNKPHLTRVRAAERWRIDGDSTGKVRPAVKRVDKKKWPGETVDFLAATPGAMGRTVADRFGLSMAQAQGRLAHLADTGRAIKIGGGWYAVSLDGDVMRKPVSPGWRPKGAIY